MSTLIRFFIFIISVAILQGCAASGLEGPFRNDPLTGGINTSVSELLNINLPPGLQRYPSHGFIQIGENGVKEGLETYRGNVDGIAANLNLFNSMHQHNWQLRLSLRKGDRSIAIYDKKDEMALLAFHRQGMLTILEIWAGPRLSDGASLAARGAFSDTEENDNSIAGEEYGPMGDEENKPGHVESWGGSVEEKEL